MKPLSPARKASLGMTAVLGIAVAAGAGSALFNAHAAPVNALRPEAQAREATPPSAPMLDDETPALSGSVLETMAASKYTYLRLATSNGEIWAAVPSASIALGSQVTIENATRMTAFKSTTLKRTFDVIYFGTLAAGATQKVATPRFSPADALDHEDDEQDLPPGHPNIGNSELGAVSDSDSLPAGHPDIGGATVSPHAPSPEAASSALPAVAVTPARGNDAHVISQLSAQRAQLAGQRVRVRGQVTKVTPGVQGHTFFHLRDGKPGDPAIDLVVTSESTPERGQVATFEGTLRADADVGIGFKYPILLENAVLLPE
ncbi:MAG: hypothetical protein WDO69_01020 [Pseudomonadota bacterium]